MGGERRCPAVFRFDEDTGAFLDMFVTLPESNYPIGLDFAPDGYLFITVRGSKAGVSVCDAATGKGLKRLVPEGRGGLENAFGLAYDPE